jgi:hypothetical protein
MIIRSALRSSPSNSRFSACTAEVPCRSSIVFTLKVTKTPPIIDPVTLPEPPRMTIVMASNDAWKL